MDAPPPSRDPNPDPRWRFVKFFAFVPWPIAMPDGCFFVIDRVAEVGCFEGHPEWLSAFMPGEVAAQLSLAGPRDFVAFRLHRAPAKRTSPHEHVLELMRMAKAWADLFTLPPALAPLVRAGEDDVAVEPEVTYGTVIEAATCFTVPLGSTEGKELNAAFDRCLEQFADFQEAYVQTSGDLRAGLVNRSTVLHVVSAVLIDPVSRRTKVTGLHAIEGAAFAATPPRELTPEQVEEIGLRVHLAKEGEPYVTVRHWQRLAHRAFWLDGDFAAAVVTIHTAGEVFFDALLLRMAWEEMEHSPGSPLTREEVAGWFTSRSPLSSRLRTRYDVRLEGGWDPDRLGHPLHDWDRKVARLRNRIVHAGYRPTEREAAAALDAAKAAEAYVLDLVVDDRNRTRYPRTVAMLVGRAGLERRGLYTGKARRAIESRPGDWRRSFYAFLQWINSRLADEGSGDQARS